MFVKARVRGRGRAGHSRTFSVWLRHSLATPGRGSRYRSVGRGAHLRAPFARGNVVHGMEGHSPASAFSQEAPFPPYSGEDANPASRVRLRPTHLLELSFASPARTFVMKFGVIVFPGSNCDHDAFYAASHNLGQPTEYIWHDSRVPRRRGCGDPSRRLRIRRLPALRCHRPLLSGDAGACSASPPMAASVLGICNGFQILVEAGLLPGALIRNAASSSSAASCGCASRPRIRLSPARFARARCCACRSPTAKAATSPTSARSTNSKPKTASRSAIWITPTARCAISPASSAASAT